MTPSAFAGVSNTEQVLKLQRSKEGSRFMRQSVSRILIIASLILALPVGVWAACTPPPPGLVSWWAGETNANDSMGNNPGTLGSGVTFSPGEVGLAFNFGGTGAVTVAASPSLDVGSRANGFSIECWIRPNDLNTRRPLLQWRDGSNEGVIFSCSDSLCGDNAVGNLFANIVDTNGNPHVLYSGLGLLTTFSNFQHVAVTYDQGLGIGTLYINGTIAAQAHLGSFTPQTSYPLFIGQSIEGGSFATFRGVMDEVSLYSRALNPSEIRAIVAAGHFGKCRPVAPFIVNQPTSQTTVAGGNASFSVTAGGTPPLTYQWRFQGGPISGATNSVLNLSNVQLSDAGNYSVVVANPIGTVTSSNALLTVSTGGCANAISGLVSWWPAEGNGNDIAGSNPGTVTGVSYSAGEVGQAFNFNGTNGSVFVPASASLNVGLSNGLTIECWIKPSELSVRHPIVEWNNGSTFGVHFYVSQDWNGGGGPGNLFANITDTGAGWHPVFTGPGVLNTSNWQHVAVTYDKTSGLGKLYLNGAQVASANLGNFTPQTSYDLYLGRRASPEVVAPFAGLMDEVSVYNRALSQGEIQTIVAAGSQGKCAPGGIAPFIITQPTNQTAAVGSSASFSVVAGGTSPLTYQWWFQGNQLTGATNGVLNLSNVQFSNAGNYSVAVSNAFGAVLSTNALLTVHEAVCTNAPAGLVSWWPGEGNGNDVAGSNPGTVTGVSYGPGEVGQAFNFNGTNGSVFIPASASLDVGLGNGLTIECWIKPSELSVRHPIVEWNNGSTFGVHFYVSHDWNGGGGPGDLFANITDTGAGWHTIFSAAGVLTTSNWQHVALTYDKTSGLGNLYLNGAQVASANLGSFTPQTSYDLYLGRRASPEVVAPFAGLMDEVSVYNRALSQGEIQAIVAAGSQGKCAASSGTAPFITTQPTNQTATVGGSASFSVVAGGTSPLTYQWRFQGNRINGATNSVLNLNNVQLSNGGNYSVAVSNAFGTVLSSNALLTVTSKGGCANASSGLVSWWPAEGNGNDVVGTNPGNVGSGVTYSTGEVGQAFNFRGTNRSVFIPASPSLDVGLSNGLTIECWIKPTELSVRHPIAEWNNGSTFGVHFYVSQDWNGGGGPGDLFANITDTGAGWHPIFSAAGVLTTSTWQHVAVTYDKSSGLGKLYLNGAEVASADLGSFTPQTSYDLYLGLRASPESVVPYLGSMDEISVYNRALSQAEIQAIAAAGSQGKCGAGTAPFIRTQPANQTAPVGGSASFSVVAGGTPPLTYQWRFQGNRISGATNSVLNLSHVQLNDAGNYSVAVSNAFGAVLSSNASLTVTQSTCTNAPAGLVSWWPGEGNGNDVAGNNPGTVTGVSYSAGEVGQAFNFNGTNGSVFIPASQSLDLGLGNGLTIECWIKPTELSVRHPIVEWNNGSTFGVHFYVSQDWNGGGGPGDLFANITDTAAGWHPIFSAAGVLSTSNWQHVAVTYDKSSGLGTLYLNGAAVASDNLGSFTPQTSYNLYLGRRGSPEAVAPYAGLMDEVSVYNRALSQAEIQAIVAAGSQGKCVAGSGTAPFIISQPTNQTVTVGANANFTVVAGGTAPLTYQWRFEGTNLSGATASSLTLNNVQLSDAGNYSVVVSNSVATVTSSNALLTVHETACTNAPAGLVSWWPAEGNGNDVAGSNPGIVTGVSYSAGEVGQAFNFNGTNGSVFIPASPSLNVGLSNGLTIECWIKPSELSVRHPIVEWNDGSTFGVHFYVSQDWGVGNGGPGDLFANITDSGSGWHPIYTAAGVLSTSNWQHVAVTYDKTSGLSKLYLNGAQVAGANLGSFTPLTSYDLYLGRRASPEAVAPFAGLMDEVSLYNRALSQSEIQAIVTAGSFGKCQPTGMNGHLAALPTETMLITRTVVGGFDVQFKGLPGHIYTVQRAPTVSGPWLTLTSVVVGPDGLGAYTDLEGSSEAAFYRTLSN